jgi:hypothetical protein
MDMMRELDMPWRIVANKGDSSTLVKGFKEKSDAEASAGERNQRAEGMGIPTRYKAVAKPPKSEA